MLPLGLQPRLRRRALWCCQHCLLRLSRLLPRAWSALRVSRTCCGRALVSCSRRWQQRPQWRQPSVRNSLLAAETADLASAAAPALVTAASLLPSPQRLTSLLLARRRQLPLLVPHLLSLLPAEAEQLRQVPPARRQCQQPRVPPANLTLAAPRCRLLLLVLRTRSLRASILRSSCASPRGRCCRYRKRFSVGTVPRHQLLEAHRPVGTTIITTTPAAASRVEAVAARSRWRRQRQHHRRRPRRPCSRPRLALLMRYQLHRLGCGALAAACCRRRQQQRLHRLLLPQWCHPLLGTTSSTRKATATAQITCWRCWRPLLCLSCALAWTARTRR